MSISRRSHVSTDPDQQETGVRQGTDLTISCEAKGSNNLRFNWYKDGALVDTSRSLRDAFQTVIPSVKEKVIRSVLSISSASPFDKGLCLVISGSVRHNTCDTILELV